MGIYNPPLDPRLIEKAVRLDKLQKALGIYDEHSMLIVKILAKQGYSFWQDDFDAYIEQAKKLWIGNG